MAVARVLVVDDNFDNREVYCDFLRYAGFEVEAAESGAIALAMIEKKPFDVILMDLSMPGINGFDATRMVKERDTSGQTRVIVLTALATFVATEMAKDAGCDAFLTKPVTPDVVERHIREQLSTR
jgi:CheY-like chemotaxis protein